MQHDHLGIAERVRELCGDLTRKSKRHGDADVITLALVLLLTGCGATENRPTLTPAPLPAASTSAATKPADLPLHWIGDWTSVAEQVTFTIDIRLAPVANGAVNGRILWTLMSAPPEHFLASRIGDSGTEFVRGEWSASTGELHLTGTSVDSPGFLVVDEYKLRVSDDRSSLDGHSRGSKKDWNNTLHAKRSDDQTSPLAPPPPKSPPPPLGGS